MGLGFYGSSAGKLKLCHSYRKLDVSLFKENMVHMVFVLTGELLL